MKYLAELIILVGTFVIIFQGTGGMRPAYKRCLIWKPKEKVEMFKSIKSLPAYNHIIVGIKRYEKVAYYYQRSWTCGNEYNIQCDFIDDRTFDNITCVACDSSCLYGGIWYNEADEIVAFDGITKCTCAGGTFNNCPFPAEMKYEDRDMLCS